MTVETLTGIRVDGAGTHASREAAGCETASREAASGVTGASSVDNASGVLASLAERILAGANAKNVVADWDDGHRYTPAPRHRRRLLLKWMAGLDFAECLDAGCAQPFLIHDIVRRFGVAGYGCDISDRVMADNANDPYACKFLELDLTRQRWPGEKRFDLVVSSEVLEHIPAWQTALDNLVAMTGRYLLITVPSGPIRAMDRMVGHHQHFAGPELADAVRSRGLVVLRQQKWGFPLQSLYKAAISAAAPEKLYRSFSGGKRYSLSKKIFSHALWATFFLNDLFRGGPQLLLLAERKDSAAAARDHKRAAR